MIRVLHIMGFADVGGISAVVLNYMKYIDQSKIHFDFALTSGEPGVNGEKMIEMGAKYYRLPLKSQGIKKYWSALYELLIKEHFDVIHVHDSLTSFVALQVAQRAGIKCRIAHSHAAPEVRGVVAKCKTNLCEMLNCFYATKLIGCGRKAGEYAFGKWGMKLKKAVVLPNAIEFERFAFNPAVRAEVRHEWSFDNRYVVGCVGRLAPEKNLLFVLEAVWSVHAKNDNIALVLVGDGVERKKLETYVAANNMSDYVRFVGRRTDVERMYQGFDCCMLTSLYEGFPVSSVEAMVSGLPLLLSNRITDELKFGSFVQYLPLDVAVWTEAILNRAQADETAFRGERIQEIRNAGFDIKQTAHILERIYDGE